MNMVDEINRRLNRCAQTTTGPQFRKNVKGLVQYVDYIARERLEDLTAFVDALDELKPRHPMKKLEVVQQIVGEYSELEFAVMNADGFLATYGNSS